MKMLRPIALLLLLPLGLAAQAVPPLVNYQGRLSTPTGSPLATADYQLTFKIYDSTNGTNLIWGPQIFDGTAGQGHGLQIPVVQGYFNVMLGPVDTNGASLANAFNATNRYVEITISNNPPIAPRQQILTVPFAFQAAYTALASNVVSGINITNAVISGNGGGLTNLLTSHLSGTITGVQIAPNTITGQQIALGGIQTSNLGAGIVTLTNLAPRQAGTNLTGIGSINFSPISPLVNSTQTFSADSGASEHAATNLTVTLVTTGRPVLVFLSSVRPTLPLASENDQESFIGAQSSYPGIRFAVNIYRSTNLISRNFFNMDTGSSAQAILSIPPACIQFIDTPPAGTNNYSVTVWSDLNAGTLYIMNVQLVAFEL